MNPTQTKAHAAVVTEVQAFMHKHGLAVSAT